MQHRYIVLTFLFLSGFLIANGQQIDYGTAENWWAHPETNDHADYTPDGPFSNRQDSAKADVFYIHPTTYYRGYKPNAMLKNGSVERLTKVVILNQATVFNSSCRVFAPKYRQTILKQFVLKKDTSKAHYFDFAYEDIKRAFEAYMANWNTGRPIIIAGHSQGSYLAQRLLTDYFEGKPLYDQLVAAYIPGYPLLASTFNRQFKQIQPSMRPIDLGCVITWSTVSDHFNDPIQSGLLTYVNGVHQFLQEDDSLICTNPLSWYTDEMTVPYDSNPGSLLSVVRPGHMPEPKKGICGAEIADGKVIVRKLKDKSFNSTGGNYHIHDYNLYWVSIRENVELRVTRYLKTH